MAERLLVSYSPLSWLSWRVAWILEQVSQTKHVKAERQHGTHSHSNAVSCAVARACRGSNSREHHLCESTLPRASCQKTPSTRLPTTMPRAWLLVTLASLAASLAPLKSFGKTKGRGIRIQDKKGNKNEAVVELFLGTAELETATVGGFTRSQKCVKVDGCAIYGEMNDQDVTRFSGCLGVICPFAAITVARDATDTRKLADALEAARRGAYAVGAEKVSGDAKEGPMGGAYKTLEKARGAVGIFGLDENVAAPKNPAPYPAVARNRP